MAYDTDDHTDDQMVRRPVTDWAGDWDWLDPAWGAEAPEIWQSLRDAGCEVAFTERYGRAWMPIGYDAISEVAYDTEHFSSFRVSVSHPDSPVRPAPPITSDPPEHHEHRRLLLPAFSPKAVDPLRDDAPLLPRADRAPRRLGRRRRCRRLLATHPGASHRSHGRGAGVRCRRVPRLDLPQLPARAGRPTRQGAAPGGHGGLLRPAPRRPGRRARRRPGDARHQAELDGRPFLASYNAGTCR